MATDLVSKTTESTTRPQTAWYIDMENSNSVWTRNVPQVKR